MKKLPRLGGAEAWVEARGERWFVLRREPFDGCELVTLQGAASSNSGRIVRLLAPFDTFITRSRSTRIERRRRHDVLRVAIDAIASAHRWLEPWTPAAERFDWLPWQFEPAMAAVGGAMRLLLLDEVGLGKTIQAGLVLSELRARALVARALILTPAALRHQWKNELQSRFDVDALVLDHEELTRSAQNVPVGVNPWTAADVVISSIDLAKRGEVRAALDAAPFDLLVVDEAHHLTPSTDRGLLVRDLAARTAWTVLATATPHSGDRGAFEFLSDIGAHAGTPPPVCFRRRSIDVGRHRARRAHVHRVTASAAERALLDAVKTYGRMLWRAATSESGAALLAGVLCRRAASSSAALARTLLRRQQLLSQTGDPEEADQATLPWLEDDEADGVGPDSVLAVPLPGDPRDEAERLALLIDLARAVEEGSKIAALKRLLSRTSETAIVFSEYRDTLLHAAEHLAPHAALAFLHGGLSVAERAEQLRAFASGRARVLLATDAAGEGLNLQERCRLVVNIELPWNPVRLEQRVGRVDRLGQRRRVHAVHLCYRDSFEEHVLARLEQRIAVAASDLQQVSFGEQAVAAAVFDGSDVARPTARAARAPSLVSRGSTVRPRPRRFAPRVADRGASVPAGSVCAPLERSRLLARGLTLLFEWDLIDAHARIVGRGLVGLELTLTRRSRLRGSQLPAWVRGLASSAPVVEAVTREQARSARATQAITGGTSRALVDRLRAIDAHLASVATPLFQGSLFDRRAERAAQSSRAVRAELRRSIADQLHAARRLASVNVSAPRLVAAWANPAE